MRRVIMESPFRGDPVNIEYAKACVADCLRKGEAPLASHLLYPGILNDDKPEERELGMRAGWAWTPLADAVVVYIDRGTSSGMAGGIEAARVAGVPIEYRQLGSHWEPSR